MSATRRRLSRLARLFTVLVGWLVIVAALDLLLGAGANALFGDPQSTAESSTPSGSPSADLSPSTSVGASPDQVSSGPCLDDHPPSDQARQRAAVPAFDGDPWALEFWCEFDQLSNDYVPYLFTLPNDVDQPYIKIRSGVRRSHEPAGTADARPVVWCFGGSTMWGWGQRDDHTICSELVRISEAAGQPIRVVNFGQLAYVHWQEVLLFERALAERAAPDVVLFYDGVNDVLSQAGLNANPSDDPTIYDFGDFPPPAVPGPFDAPVSVAAPPWYRSWADSSATLRAGRDAWSLFGAQPAAADDDPPPSRDVEVRRTVDVYERGRALAADLARQHATTPIFYWQPHRWGVPGSHLWEEDRPAPPHTIDLTHVLDGVDPDEIYSDEAHTNERGAHLVAQAMWADVASALAGTDDGAGA